MKYDCGCSKEGGAWHLCRAHKRIIMNDNIEKPKTETYRPPQKDPCGEYNGSEP